MSERDRILETYGYCILPIGLKIYSEKDEEFGIVGDRETFFVFDINMCGSGAYGDTLYEASLKKELTCIAPFYVKNYRSGDLMTLFPEIFINELNQDWTFRTNVNMKSDIILRQTLIEFCKNNNIDGWVSPLTRDIYNIELCIFNPDACISDIKQIKPLKKRLDTSYLGNYIKCIPPINHRINAEEYKKTKITNKFIWSPFDHFIT